MELAQGTLQDKLRDKQPSEAEVVDILLQVARGLDYLHREKRLVHRDVKPGNILRCQEQWKLSDFGLSRQMSDKSQSRTGNIAGSIAFMPPEAFGNESYEIWEKFGDKVGWRKGGSWLDRRDRDTIIFDKKAPEGHLPVVWGFGWACGKCSSSIAPRLIEGDFKKHNKINYLDLVAVCRVR